MTIAIAHGRTLGAGADLFVACDRRIALTGSSFSFPGPGFGLVLGTARLAQRIGRDAARALLVAGRSIDADEALARELATERCEKADLPVLLSSIGREAAGRSGNRRTPPPGDVDGPARYRSRQPGSICKPTGTEAPDRRLPEGLGERSLSLVDGRSVLLQALVKCGACFFGVVPCGAFRRLRRAGQNGLGDGGVFTPGRSADLGVRERRAHAALEMGPKRRDRFGDREISGQRYTLWWKATSASIQSWTGASEASARAGREALPQRVGSKGGLSLSRCARRRGGMPARQWPRATDTDRAFGSGRLAQPTGPPAVYDHQALPFQQLKRVAYRLARNAKPLRDFLLGKPFPRR